MMAISGIASSGLISGLDTNSLITQILEIESRPINLLGARKNDYELKIASVLSLSSKLSSYNSSLKALNSAGKFNTKTASVTKTSGGTELLSVSANETAAAGSYSINVNQLAAASKKASQGWVDQNSTAINSSGGTFKFKVGSAGAEKSITVTSTMTLQGLRDAINSADTGVTASIINDGTGSNPYRLILTANKMGSSNDIIITDDQTADQIADNLGFIDGAGGTPKKIEDAYAYTTNTYSGTVASNSGNNYTGTTNKTFLMEAVSAGESGTATYKYSIDGGINWLGYNGVAYNSSATAGNDGAAIITRTDYTDYWIDGLGSPANSNNENVKVQFTAGSSMAVGDRFTIDVFNPEMQEAKDAVIEVDNATIVKSSNTITDAIQGVTMNLLKADTSSTLTLTVSSDTSTANSNIKNFVDSYNYLYEFINDQLSYDPDTGVANPLLGDPTILEIRRKIANTMTGVIPGLSTTSYTNLSQIGITSDYKTGKLSIDETKLSNALSKDSDAVAKLFIGTATPTNQAITFVSKTSKTQTGTHRISISTAPEQATRLGDNNLSTTSLGADETLTFMYSENYTESTPAYTTFSVTLNSGTTINTIVNNLNSAFATNSVGLSATNNSGALKITSTDYGADVWFQVHTDQGNASNQIWDTSDTRSDAGVDIVGSINNHAGIGDGNVLTSVASGFAEEGLKISTTSNQTGQFGTITVSSGIADSLSSTLDSYVDSISGVLKLKESSMQDTIDDIEDRMDRMGKKIADKEERLRAEFARLEVVLSKHDSLTQYLTNALTSLPKIR